LGRLTGLPAKPPRCQFRARPRLPGSRASVQLPSGVRPPGPSPASVRPGPASGWLAADPGEPPNGAWLTAAARAAPPASAAIAVLVAVLVREASIDTALVGTQQPRPAFRAARRRRAACWRLAYAPAAGTHRPWTGARLGWRPWAVARTEGSPPRPPASASRGCAPGRTSPSR